MSEVDRAQKNEARFKSKTNWIWLKWAGKDKNGTEQGWREEQLEGRVSKTCLYLYQTAKGNISKARRFQSAMTPVTGLKSGIRAFIHSSSVHCCRCKDASITLNLTSPSPAGLQLNVKQSEEEFGFL